MKLYALSDLHLNHALNREAMQTLPAHPDDWLVVAGDVTESTAVLAWLWELLVPRWGRVIWVPGNHELWTVRDDGLRGDAKYQALVATCRDHGVLTPEDDYVDWPGDGPPTKIAPLFLLYDYSFAPDGYTPAQALAWAADDGIMCADERYLHPHPFASRQAWCAARVEDAAARLDAIDSAYRTVLINHWPLRQDLVRLFRIPRFVPWCGTRRTEDWHVRYRARAVVSGHLHMRATDWRDGVRFEEVSLGYPRHWKQERGSAYYLREILPGTGAAPPSGHGGPVWHR